MSHFVDVDLGFDRKATVEYSPAALMKAPIEVAYAAIEIEEARFLLRHMTNDVMVQLGVVFATCTGPFELLAEYENRLRLVDGYPELQSCGVWSWQFDLICPECDGDGITYTKGNREVDCPCCATLGYTHSFSVFTDLDGRFTGFPPRPVWKPAMANFDEYDFEALPLDDELEAAREAL